MATVMKTRVHELAGRLGATSSQVLEVCHELGIVATTASSGLDGEAVERVRRRLMRRDAHEVDQAAGDGYWAGVMHGHGRPSTETAAESSPPPPAPAPVTAAPVTAAPAPSTRGRKGVFVVLLGAVGLGVGSFLPWLTATVPFVGTISRSGLDGGGDGILTLIAGIVVALLGFRLLRGPSPAVRTTLMVAGALALVLVGFEFADVSHRMNQTRAASSLIATSYGAGLYVLALAAVAVIGGSLAVKPQPDRA